MNRQESFGAPQSEDARYRLLVDAITDYAVYMLDPQGMVSSWNPGAERFKGYTASEIVGRHFSQFYTEEERAADAPMTALRTAVAEGRFEKEGWRIRKDGGRFWAHVVIDPIRTPEGEILGFAKITRDLTERRAAEAALKQSEQQFRLLVQGVTDYAIYMLDPTGKVSSWNAGAERIKGYLADEIIGQHFSRFYSEDDRAKGAPDAALATAAQVGRFEKEGWRLRKDGSRFWAHVVIDAIRSDDGAVIGFAKITRDITEREEAQRALDLAREALFQSQKLEAIGQLTGGVAHDFNNLLMAVLGSLELVRKRVPEDPRITPLIDNAMHGARRGAALTQRMLAFARKQDLKPEAVALPSLMTDMMGLLQRLLGPTIRIQADLPHDIPPLRTDANQLEAAILNLVVNARDAMPDGGTIRIEAAAQTVDAGASIGLPAGPYIVLSVTDTGEGMDEATVERATEPFFTTKGIGKGTGLGLSMVHGLVEQSGGRLQISSQLGKGTAISLWLPQATAADSPDSASPPPVLGKETKAPTLVVLAVDDDSLVLMNTVAMLEDLGHRALEAASAEEAMAVLERERVDLVITDYAMPQITGAQLAKAIHARHPGLPVILATGYAELPSGADDGLPRLPKPFLLGDLARALQQVTPGKLRTPA